MCVSTGTCTTNCISTGTCTTNCKHSTMIINFILKTNEMFVKRCTVIYALSTWWTPTSAMVLSQIEKQNKL